MSGYENVVGGKLKLKGKALDVKAAGMKKKKKKQNKIKSDEISMLTQNDLSLGTNTDLTTDPVQEDVVDAGKSTEENPVHWDAHMTPAERRYVEQRERIDQHRLAKTANKSHRDRIEDFNQYLANMSEHYDIPKVGPG